MEEKKGSRKEAILEIARTILIEEGHHRLTMRRLTEKVGIKLASLQYHYPTKNALIGALIEKSVQTYHHITLDLIRSIRVEESDGPIGRLFDIYQDEMESGVFEQLWALSVQDPDLKKQYDGLYLAFWEKVTAEIALFDPQASENACRSRAAMVIALLDGLEIFIGAELLKQNLPSDLQTDVVSQVRAIATGRL